MNVCMNEWKIEKTELAKSLYFKTNKSQKEICKIVGWSQNTFTRIKTKEHWDEQKAASILTNDQVISQLRIQAKKITDNADKDGQRILTTSEVDSIAKLSSSIDKLSTKINISAIIDSGILFIDWINLTYGQSEAIEISNLFDQFIKSRLSNS